MSGMTENEILEACEAIYAPYPEAHSVSERIGLYLQSIERDLADAGDRAEPDLVRLQHAIVEWDRCGTHEPVSTEGQWDAVHGR